jgi:SAM-dependent methyltransferase
MINKNKIFLSPSKTNLYINKAIRAKYSDLEKSKRIILSKLNLNNKKILDVGCASGDFYSVLKKKYKNIDYHGIDLDDKCIQFAKKKFGNNASFDKLDIFSKKLKSKYDVVMIWNLFYMIPDWKKFLIRSSELSKKYIIFDNKIRLTGPTIIDLDLSYQYYHKSNKRNYYIVHNIHELIAFLQIHELNLNKICINGYKLPGPTSAKLPLDKKEIYVGGLILQKYDRDSKINRYGVTSESAKTSWVKISINIAK